MIRTHTAAAGALLLLAALLVGCSAVMSRPPDVRTESEAADTPVEAPAGIADKNQPEPAFLEDRLETSTITNSAEDILPAAATLETGRSEETPGPVLGKITFALETTPDFEPVVPGFFFTQGITQVHALFEYQGMSKDDTWERAWHLDEVEVARILEPWTGSESGIFDYYIDNNGDPLPPGDYILALYVNGDLQQLGVFVIDDAPAGVAAP